MISKAHATQGFKLVEHTRGWFFSSDHGSFCVREGSRHRADRLRFH